MNTLAYCDLRYARATREASGVEPFTSPPIDVRSFAARCGPHLRAAKLVYFNLHATPERTDWPNTAGGVALDAVTLRLFDWDGKVVYLVNCHAGGGLLEVLQALQPEAIIGGFGENLGGRDALAGADLLGMWFRRWLQWGATPRIALRLAKSRLALGAQTASVRDALGFEVLYEREV